MATGMPIDDSDPRKYMQIARNLEKQITVGALESGDIVTVSELSADFQVTRQTARHALRVIGERGLIAACGTAGFMVTNRKGQKGSGGQAGDQAGVSELTDMITRSLDKIEDAFFGLRDAVLKLDATATKLVERTNQRAEPRPEHGAQ